MSKPNEFLFLLSADEHKRFQKHIQAVKEGKEKYTIKVITQELRLFKLQFQPKKGREA